jgi:hypothetical protein
MSRHSDGPGGTFVFGFGDPRYGKWGGEGILEKDPNPFPSVARVRSDLPRDAEAKISNLRVVVKASERAFRQAERQLKADKAELAALLAKHGLPPED